MFCFALQSSTTSDYSPTQKVCTSLVFRVCDLTSASWALFSVCWRCSWTTLNWCCRSSDSATNSKYLSFCSVAWEWSVDCQSQVKEERGVEREGFPERGREREGGREIGKEREFDKTISAYQFLARTNRLFTLICAAAMTLQFCSRLLCKILLLSLYKHIFRVWKIGVLFVITSWCSWSRAAPNCICKWATSWACCSLAVRRAES